MTSIDLSVVMPCLNEADTLEICIQKARAGIEASGLTGEIIIADNGSTDGSIQIAENAGARVVHAKEKGYGSALAAGFSAALGEFIIMGDADDSYDFLEIPNFTRKLREGNDFVQGCRLPAGGGKIMPGAMPFSHRYLGNPLFSFLARQMFNSPVQDIYCGLRGFKKQLYERMELRCRGMEFATEMIIKASFLKAKVVEIPITLHCDGRKAHAPHLRTMRDGWRTLRFFLIFCPRWLFLYPGVFLIVIGLLGYSIAMPGLRIEGIVFDAHTLLFSSLFLIMGYQSIVFSIFAYTYAINERWLPGSKGMETFYKFMYLERGIALGLAAFLTGLVLLGAVLFQWRSLNFGHLNYPDTLRKVIPGITLAALGYQTVLSSFLISMLGINRRPPA
jgi:glycosyltransferase involved in cell wall biosynthesis